MKVHGVNKYGVYSNDVEIVSGDMFSVDIEDVSEDLASRILNRGLEIKFVVDSIDEEKGLVYAKNFDYPIPAQAILKYIKD